MDEARMTRGQPVPCARPRAILSAARTVFSGLGLPAGRAALAAALCFLVAAVAALLLAALGVGGKGEIVEAADDPAGGLRAVSLERYREYRRHLADLGEGAPRGFLREDGNSGEVFVLDLGAAGAQAFDRWELALLRGRGEPAGAPLPAASLPAGRTATAPVPGRILPGAISSAARPGGLARTAPDRGDGAAGPLPGLAQLQRITALAGQLDTALAGVASSRTGGAHAASGPRLPAAGAAASEKPSAAPGISTDADGHDPKTATPPAAPATAKAPAKANTEGKGDGPAAGPEGKTEATGPSHDGQEPANAPDASPVAFLVHPLQAAGRARTFTSDPAPFLPAPLLRLTRWAPLAGDDREAALAALRRRPAIDRAKVDALLAEVPGVRLTGSPGQAPDALLVLAQPECPPCGAVLSLLEHDHERLHFPVLFLPVGRRGRDFYQKDAAATAQEREAMEGWALKAGAFLERDLRGVRSTPAYVWILDGLARYGTLSAKEVTALADLLEARAQGRGA